MKEFSTGDILFVRGNSIISKLIKVIDGEYSHCAIAMNDNGHILEAQRFTKSRIVPVYFDDYDVVKLNLTDEQKEKIVEYGIRLTGIKYDYAQVIGYLVEWMFGFNKDNFWNDPKKLLCSELVDLILYLVGYFGDDEYVGDMTPNQLFEYLHKIDKSNK